MTNIFRRRAIMYWLPLLIFGFAFGSQNDEEAEKEKGKRVSIAPVEEEYVTQSQKYPAYVVPLQETELRAEVSGFITILHVSDGAYVQQGQKLYEIDHIRYAAALEQAEAAVLIAEAEYDRVSKDLDRYETLAEDNAIARQTLDYTRTDLQNRHADLKNARAMRITAQTDYKRSVIYAPFSGMLGVPLVRKGTFVAAGETVLNMLSSIDPMAVEFQINERDIAKFQELANRSSTEEIQIKLPEAQTYAYGGQVSLIDRAVDRSTGTLRIRALFPNPDHQLRAGMNVELSVKEDSEKKEMVIPQKALISELGAYHVFIAGDGDTVSFKEVQPGQRFGEKVVIKSGLDLEHKVIVEGARNLSEGDKIQIKSP